jgi:hypothetical protein
MVQSLTPFFAPAFFSPYYFPLLVATAPTPNALQYRDLNIFLEIVTALRSTAEFAEVLFGSAPERRASGADRLPAAILTPDEWQEADETDPTFLIRRITFSLTVIAREEDPTSRYSILDRLTCIAQNVVDGSNLGGMTIASLTRLRGGRFDPRYTHPEQGVVLSGEFTYIVPSNAGHDTE